MIVRLAVSILVAGVLSLALRRSVRALLALALVLVLSACPEPVQGPEDESESESESESGDPIKFDLAPIPDYVPGETEGPPK